MEEATGGRDPGVWQPPAPELDGGEVTGGGVTVPGRAPAADEQEAPGSDIGAGVGDHPLDIAPVAVVDSTSAAPAGRAVTLPPGLDKSRSQAGGTKKAGGGRRRTSVALLTATGVMALAAAPFAVASSKEHFVGEPTSSTSKEHHKAAAKKPNSGRTVAAPVPTWPTQGSPAHPGNSQPAPGEMPDQAASGTPSPSPTAPGSPVPSPSPSTPSESPHVDHARSKGHPDSGSGKVPSSPDRPARTSPADNQAVRTVREPRPTTSATAAEHHAKAKASPATEQASSPGQTRVIHGTYVWQPGQEVHTNRIRLTLRTDGDLVLLDEHGKVVWSTRTHASGTHAVFQADGNFVVYSSSNATLWSSRTDGHDGAVLVLQGDGNLAIMQGNTTLWNTGTGK